MTALLIIMAFLFAVLIVGLVHVGTYRTPEMELEEREEQSKAVRELVNKGKFRIIH